MSNGDYPLRRDPRSRWDLSWKAKGACSGMDPNLWYPERDTDRTGQSICAECPVRQDCLDFGLKEEDGIWGGLGPRERRAVYRRRLRATHAERMALKVRAS